MGQADFEKETGGAGSVADGKERERVASTSVASQTSRKSEKVEDVVEAHDDASSISTASSDSIAGIHHTWSRNTGHS
jgi:hypothetical protein